MLFDTRRPILLQIDNSSFVNVTVWSHLTANGFTRCVNGLETKAASVDSALNYR